MAELFEYKCPNCGGSLKFDSKAQEMKCPYCGSLIGIEELEEQERELLNREDEIKWDEIASNTWSDEEIADMVVYVCNSCGGEIVASRSTGATTCPYCDSPVVMKGNFEGDLKPDVVIPFKVNKQEAKAAYLKHLEGKPFLPKVFKDRNHIDEMKALYVPFWLFDCDTDAEIRYDATRVSCWSDNNNNYTKTDHYLAIREGNMSFENVPVDASVAMPDELVQSVEPFDYSEAVPFKTAYLAGYLADKYTFGITDAMPIANARVKSSVEDVFGQTVNGYATVRPRSSHIKTANGRNKYAMYPVWVLNTTFEGEHYVFSINGQTGKTAGDLPVDKGAFWRYVVSRTGIMAVAFTAIQLALTLL